MYGAVFQKLISLWIFLTYKLYITSFKQLICCLLFRLVYIKYKILKMCYKTALFSEFANPQLPILRNIQLPAKDFDNQKKIKSAADTKSIRRTLLSTMNPKSTDVNTSIYTDKYLCR